VAFDEIHLAHRIHRYRLGSIDENKTESSEEEEAQKKNFLSHPFDADEMLMMLGMICNEARSRYRSQMAALQGVCRALEGDEKKTEGSLIGSSHSTVSQPYKV
jgi:hypothetical protein